MFRRASRNVYKRGLIIRKQIKSTIFAKQQNISGYLTITNFMKHLVKKYIRCIKVGQDVIDVINNAPIDENKLKEFQETNLEGYYGLIQTEDNEIVQSFKYIHNNHVYLIAEPDPIVIYFDTASFHQKEINKRREKLFEELEHFGKNIHATNAHFYWYYSTVCTSIIFLFLSIEALINKIIKPDFEYRKPIGDKRVELYDKYQIQRQIDFIEKIKIVLPLATGKNFVVEHGHKFEQIKMLKEFRDEIVHTKSLEGQNSPNFYQDLFVMSLDFDFDKTLLYVKDFINFHQDGLIEECNCGKD